MIDTPGALPLPPGYPVAPPGRNASTPMWRANLASLIARRSVYNLDLLGEAGMSVQLSGEFPERISDVTPSSSMT